MKRLLTEAEVETTYGINARTLQQWRHRGVGPKYVKLGRAVRYNQAEIEKYLADNTVETKGSEGSGRSAG